MCVTWLCFWGRGLADERWGKVEYLRWLVQRERAAGRHGGRGEGYRVRMGQAVLFDFG